MAKAKCTKKPVKRLTPKQLQARSNGFSGIDKIKIDQAQSRLAFVKSEISHIYEMSKSFESQSVKRYVDEKLAEEKDLIDRFPKAQTIPYHITIGAYKYQDLAIALILCHVETPIAWSFDAVIELEQEDEFHEMAATVNYSLTLPSMTHIEFLRGKKDCKIDHGHGLKTVGWRGFDREVIKELESHKELYPEGCTEFSIKRIDVDLRADMQFINTAAYEEFRRIQKWVEAGHEVAESELRNLWIREQEAGSTAKTYGYKDAV
ncbi:hypothetical protein [Acinetobacter colistiniresistens]|uniref:hypothetical protein n=1 Tax=Acinetobacter colistiniresistens TaxID=280145 RepID=UPI00124FA128|nr:hypothetical protein [Acinetobacter colistiniresistens]